MTHTLDGTTKEALRRTIRELRERLLVDLHAATEGEYQLSVKPEKARLSEAQRVRRSRLDAWLDEQVRSVPAKEQKEARDRFRAQAEKEAAYTLLHRLVVIRQLEGHALLRPAVIAGCSKDWRNSQALRELTEHAPELCQDETEGFRFLLSLVFGELALDLPGLFGEVGLTSLVPIPTQTLKAVVESLASEDLKDAWTDDTTLGWVYQYWNDPDREALDDKIARREKIAPHEIASKTQMFTERYMVEWLLQNSLGPMWLSICEQHGWTPHAERVLGDLEARRIEWRKKREAGEVPLDALMPIHGELEEHWKYYVPGARAGESAPDSIRTLKLLDPACGSGHFLVIAFDYLAALYREEAEHRALPLPRAGEGRGEGQSPRAGEGWGEGDIVQSILANNLFGIDIDPRAVQIAAAALYLKARSRCPEVRLRQLNLVAPVFRLGKLPASDPAVVSLRADLKAEAGIPEELTTKLLASLAGVDHLGSLLRVSTEVDAALKSAEVEIEKKHGQGDLFGGFPSQQVKLTLAEARATVLDRLERFLEAHTSAEDLGLRLDGEQLAAGIRFVRMAREGTYDIVVGNPPYQGLSKTTDAFGYVATTYPRGKADLYAAFLERGLQLVRPGGVSAMIVMRGWMFLGQFEDLRKYILHHADLRLGDLGWGAFEIMTDNPVTMSLMVKTGSPSSSVALSPADPTARVRTDEHRRSLASGLLAQVGRHDFDPRSFAVIDGEPLVYWWTKEFLREYAEAPKLGTSSPARVGMKTSNNTRFVRYPFELAPMMKEFARLRVRNGDLGPRVRAPWAPYIQGAAGRAWFEPLTEVVLWETNGFAIKVTLDEAYGMPPQAERHYFRGGIAFAPIGSRFSSRLHRFRSIFSTTGTSLFPADAEGVLCALNSSRIRRILEELNPGTHFEVRDVNRVPIRPIAEARAIMATLDGAFDGLEAQRECSVEFRRPAPSVWTYTQDWAQRAVDRPPGTPLPPYEPVYDPPTPASYVSFTVGVALGRFGANGEGILDALSPTAGASGGEVLPAGILFVSATEADSLEHPACAPLHAAWAEHGSAVEPGASLREYLSRSFFGYHKGLYENRPIYFPLSSSKKSFVALVSIHRWTDATLPTLLADHLLETRKRIVGEVADLGEARTGGDKKRAREAERRYAQLGKWLEELDDFIEKVKACSEKGAPPVDDKCPRREVDAPFHMDLDDGVMINSAALWPLLEPQWKDPKKWWRELASAADPTKGAASSTAKAKDYDWAHLARRYWPTRVDAKCKVDPSLGVAHGCFWKYHPAKAYAWELRLQHEMEDPKFTIDEDGSAGLSSDGARAAFLRDHAGEAKEIEEKETKRRARKGGGEEEAQQSLPVEGGDDETEGEEAVG